jgi:tight adherence protein B
VANAQIRKLLSRQDSRMESLASGLVPKPAVMRLRLEKTGRQITLGRYAVINVGLLVVVAA